jgi:hypothetical protein
MEYKKSLDTIHRNVFIQKSNIFYTVRTVPSLVLLIEGHERLARWARELLIWCRTCPLDLGIVRRRRVLLMLRRGRRRLGIRRRPL